MKRKSAQFLSRGGAISLTIAAAALSATLLLLAFSSSFLEALGLFFLGPFKNAYYFGNMLSSSVALAVAGLGASLAFGSRNFNLGGEGQVYLGAIAAVLVCLGLPPMPPAALVSLAMAARHGDGRPHGRGLGGPQAPPRGGRAHLVLPPLLGPRLRGRLPRDRPPPGPL